MDQINKIEEKISQLRKECINILEKSTSDTQNSTNQKHTNGEEKETKLITYNTRSMSKKALGVCDFIDEEKIDIALIQEVWCNNTYKILQSEVEEHNLNAMIDTRDRTGGGLATIHNKEMKIKKEKCKDYKTFEIQEMTVKAENTRMMSG